jgi:hypothetical protein
LRPASRISATGECNDECNSASDWDRFSSMRQS